MLLLEALKKNASARRKATSQIAHPHSMGHNDSLDLSSGISEGFFLQPTQR